MFSDVKLFRGIDEIKDQTFFLSQISQPALRRTMFPLGKMYKKDVKKLAIEAGLSELANKKESYGICFIGKRNFKEFISEYIGENAGDFVDIETGKIIGRHNGIHNFTLGQNIKICGCREKMYITRKMPDKCTMLVAPGRNHPAFYSDMVFTDAPHWIDSSPFERTGSRRRSVFDAEFCFQHIDPLVSCKIYSLTNGLIVKLNQSLRALTPGQYATFYKNGECLGSARIIKPGPSEQFNDKVNENQEFDSKDCDSNSDDHVESNLAVKIS